MNYSKLLGLSKVEIGESISKRFKGDELVKYFENKFKDSEENIKAIVKRFNLKNKRILSIASGTGAEEVHFAQYGNIVECIEPDSESNLVCQQFAGKLGVANKIIVHQTTVQNFYSLNNFDFIYCSSPSDWMHSDFRQVIPEYYLNPFNLYQKPKCTILVKFYGGGIETMFSRILGWLNHLLRNCLSTQILD